MWGNWKVQMTAALKHEKECGEMQLERWAGDRVRLNYPNSKGQPLKDFGE